MDTLFDFLTFKRFISFEALMVFYYTGALVMPFMAWGLSFWLLTKYQHARTAYQAAKTQFWSTLSWRHRLVLIMSFVVALAFMQLFWRMLFEFLIAYLQIRDSVMQLAL
ncbi:DUF4282 domain-containing protein [Thiomicrorhabdus aquaedulcis]|uniref:DUF4282 domain-containing protein n=1 Tax=Thiomicrorhabdus aquaedulcis TaxID=2211106 RepID=UPI000FDC812A|nr:DUF4282 domain-containing protein [Thiomicrorhabdus aquaedulcis]